MKAATYLALACTVSLITSGCASSRDSAAAHTSRSSFWASTETSQEREAETLTGWTVRPVSDSP